GALDTKYVKWDSEGRVKITGGAIDIATDSQEKSLLRFTYGAMQMSLTPSSFKLTNTTSGKSIYIYNFTSIPNIGLYDGTGRVVELSTNGIDMPTKPIICGDLSSNGGEVLTTLNYASKGITYPASTSGFTGSLIMGASRINVSDGLITGVSSA
ncbi:MAG TPA: hypothetical protein VJ903_05225, partial [Clostridia bacterium]|nr:hypothetical protein [Clostridia bacterium]